MKIFQLQFDGTICSTDETNLPSLSHVIRSERITQCTTHGTLEPITICPFKNIVYIYSCKLKRDYGNDYKEEVN